METRTDLPSEQIAADLRTLRIIWLAVAGGVVLLTAVMSYLVSTGNGGTVEQRDLFFYLNAAISMGAIVGAFMVQRGLTEALPRAGSYAEASALIRTRGIISVAVIEASAFFAAVAAFLTGDLLNLAFVLPFFAFVFFFFPSEPRYLYWLSLWRGERT